MTMRPLDESDRQALLRVAHAAVAKTVAGASFPEPLAVSPALLQPAGAFVTLKIENRLRGCIGHVVSDAPLYQTVAECAVSSALRDPRFKPVRASELPSLHFEISVLSPLFAIAPGDIEVGKHGLMITKGWRRGLLLPQVAVEWKWDPTRFLEETCIKAGLDPNAWQHGAAIEAFTAEVFEDSVSPAVTPL